MASKKIFFIEDKRHPFNGKKPAGKKSISIPGDCTLDLMKKLIRVTFELPECTIDLYNVQTREDITEDDHIKDLSPSHVVSFKATSNSLNISQVDQVNIEPHYETLTNSGLYAYYDSHSYHSLYFAISELIDNSLSATLGNEMRKKDRRIEVRWYIDKDDSRSKHVFVVVDNGHGMNKETLTNWGRYKYAKHKREESEKGFKLNPDFDLNCPRFLNSNISKFGAGGKESAFYIGKSVRVVTKNFMEDDVRIMELSTKDFEKKEQEGAPIFQVPITTRPPGVETLSETVPKAVINHLTKEEKGKDSFTYIIISDIASEKHIDDLSDIHLCSRQLSDVYHFYLHGIAGDKSDDAEVKKRNAPQSCRNLEIFLKHYVLSKGPPVVLEPELLQQIDLREVHNGAQSTWIRNQSSQFEFRGSLQTVPAKKFEGILRYYHFQYEKETYPGNIYEREERLREEEARKKVSEDDDDSSDADRIRNDEQKIVTYWNGRLIPYTTLPTLNFMEKFRLPDKSTAKERQEKRVPSECYNRLHGVLFFNDEFRVTQNKLTFQDNLNELFNLRYDEIVFECKDMNGRWMKRGIETAFRDWILQCHKELDKMIKFIGMMDVIARHDISPTTANKTVSNDHYPWTQFREIQMASAKMKIGDKFKSSKRTPIAGEIVFFLLQGDYKITEQERKGKPVYGSNAYIAYKPIPCFDVFDPKKPKYIAMRQISMDATDKEIQQVIHNVSSKVPTSITVAFQGYEKNNKFIEAIPLNEGQTIRAGQLFGPFVVDVLDRNNKTVTQVGSNKKINVSLKIFREGETRPTVFHNTVHSKSQEYKYWFDQMNCCTKTGSYYVLLESGLVNAPSNGMSCGIEFPTKKIKFEVVAEDADYVIIPDNLVSRVGTPFDIHLTFQDRYENDCEDAPNVEMKAVIIATSGDFVYETGPVIKRGNKLIIQQVLGKGTVGPISRIPSELSLRAVDRKKEEYDFKPAPFEVAFRPGRPHRLQVFPEENIRIENGTLPQIGAKVFDVAGNIVSKLIEEDLQIVVRFYDKDKKEQKKYFEDSYFLDFLTGPDGNLCNLKGGAVLKVSLEDKQKVIYAEISVKCPHLELPPVLREITVLKVSKITDLRLYYSSEFDEDIECELRHEEIVNWTAGMFINNVHFKMFDDGGCEVEKPNLNTTNFRVSWTSSEWVDKSAIPDLNERKLPKIRAPKVAGDTASFTITFFDTVSGTFGSRRHTSSNPNITFTFIVKAVVGDPAALKVTCSQTKVKAGMPLDQPLVVKIVDYLDNAVVDLSNYDLENLSLSCETGKMNTSLVEKSIGDFPGEIHFTGISFGETKPCEVNLHVTYKTDKQELKGQVTVDIIHADPDALEWKLEDCAFDNTQTLPVVNRSDIGIFKLELLDQFQNNCRIPNIPVSIGWHRDITGGTSKGKQVFTDSMGQVDFGRASVGVKSTVAKMDCPVQLCSGSCYGIYKVRARADLSCIRPGLTKMSPLIKIHIRCNEDRVDRVIIESSEIRDDKFVDDMIVGKKMPKFVCKLIAEDERAMKCMNVANVILCTKLAGSSGAPSRLQPSGYDEETGSFEFNGLEAPKQTGEYLLWVDYVRAEDRSSLQSKRVEFRVVAGAAAKIIPVEEPTIASWVSNVPDRAKRSITKGLTLRLTDNFGNPVPADDSNCDGPAFDGTLTVSIIKTKESEEQHECPRFEEGPIRTFKIVKGKVHIDALYLAEKSPGTDVTGYTVVFMPSFPRLDGHDIKSYKIDFNFANEGQKIEELKEITEKRASCQRTKKKAEEAKNWITNERLRLKAKYESINAQFINRLNDSHRNSIINNINSKSEAKDIEREKKLIENKLRKLEQKEERETVANKLAPAPNEPGVVGRIAHLAQVDNPTDNLVVSWILRGDMDCIVTESYTKAKDLMSRMGDRQQVLPIELCRRTEWSGPLPHGRSRNPIEVTGNPVFARHLLIFTQQHERACRTVFGNLLSDTVVIDTIDDAVEYRKTLSSQGLYCPNIVTRDGKKLTSTGKLGGVGNIIPQDFQNKGVLFARTPSKEYQLHKEAIKDVIDLLEISKERDEAFRDWKRYEADTARDFTAANEEVQKMTHLLSELDDMEKEITRKRRHLTVPNLDEPPMKRFR